MLEFGQQPAAAPASDAIIDGTDASFMADVVEASREVPVIVDFWATWCGPCKTLSPVLEKLVTEAAGKVKLVKIDIDKDQQFAQQLRVQSIPTVIGFWQGQPVEAFQGSVPQSQVKAFIDKLVALGGDGGLSDAIAAAEQMLAEGAAVDAAQTFAAILEEDRMSAEAYSGLARAHVAMDDLENAEAIINGVPAEISMSAPIEAARAQLALKRQAAKAGPVAELTARVEADPGDHQARYDLALALHATGKVQEAVDQLIELFRRDREWNDGAAKAQLFTIFDALPAKDPVVLSGRRRLSSLIFA